MNENTFFIKLAYIVIRQSFHQVASLLRREHMSAQGADLRSTMPQAPETFDLTTEKVREHQTSNTINGLCIYTP